MDEAYRHMKIQPFGQADEESFPTRMEPTFSLAFLRKCKDGAVILNADGRVGFLNDPALEALGLESVGDVVQRQWTNLWPETAHEKMSAALDRVLNGDAVRLAGIPSEVGNLDMLFAPVINQDSQVESVFAVMFPSGSSPRISG